MKHRIHLHQADPVALAIVQELRSSCAAIGIAGSVRRREHLVGDIELVAIPRTVPTGLFGDEETSVLLGSLNELVEQGRLQLVKGGEKYRQYVITRSSPMCLDLFIVRPETWGVQYTIRTGPAQFSKALVTPRCQGGLLPDNMRIADGRLWRCRRDLRNGDVLEDGEAIETPTEQQLFSAIGIEWIEPWCRADWLQKRRSA